MVALKPGSPADGAREAPGSRNAVVALKRPPRSPASRGGRRSRNAVVALKPGKVLQGA